MSRLENWQNKYYEPSALASSALTLCGLVVQGIATFTGDIDTVNAISYITVPGALYTLGSISVDKQMRHNQNRKELEGIKLSDYQSKN